LESKDLPARIVPSVITSWNEAVMSGYFIADVYFLGVPIQNACHRLARMLDS
jgi:hypothetical protein